MSKEVLLILMAFSWCAVVESNAGAESESRVVLLHGLARTSSSMDALAKRLGTEGYSTCNVSYPSRKHTIEKLAAEFVLPAIVECFGKAPGAIHFVTHSLGGIIVRQLAASSAPMTFGRVVMLAPPNGGSEVVDTLGEWGLFHTINGPAGRQLGTSKDSLPNSLGPAPFEVGIITGNRSINPILSAMIDGDDDGKVSVENAKLEGMVDFLVVPVSHPFIMKNRGVAEQTVHFLNHGAFRASRVQKRFDSLTCANSP